MSLNSSIREKYPHLEESETDWFCNLLLLVHQDRNGVFSLFARDGQIHSTGKNKSAVREHWAKKPDTLKVYVTYAATAYEDDRLNAYLVICKLGVSSISFRINLPIKSNGKASPSNVIGSYPLNNSLNDDNVHDLTGNGRLPKEALGLFFRLGIVKNAQFTNAPIDVRTGEPVIQDSEYWRNRIYWFHAGDYSTLKDRTIFSSKFKLLMSDTPYQSITLNNSPLSIKEMANERKIKGYLQRNSSDNKLLCQLLIPYI